MALRSIAISSQRYLVYTFSLNLEEIEINHQKEQRIFRAGKNRTCGRVPRSDALMTELLRSPHCISLSILLGFFVGGIDYEEVDKRYFDS